MTTTATISVAFDDAVIPAQLKVWPTWVCWRAVWNEEKGRVEKVPICPMTGRNASTTNPDEWSDYVTAVMTASADESLGIGFVFTLESGIVGVDLDHCRNSETGNLEPRAAEIVRMLNSYTEISPSGTGLHIYTRGRLPPGRRHKGNIEAYAQAHYFTVTGVPLSEKADAHD